MIWCIVIKMIGPARSPFARTGRGERKRDSRGLQAPCAQMVSNVYLTSWLQGTALFQASGLGSRRVLVEPTATCLDVRLSSSSCFTFLHEPSMICSMACRAYPCVRHLYVLKG